MTAPEQLDYIRQQALPRLQEGGMEALVVVGYLRLEDGSIQRVCFAHTGNSPAYEDGLRQIIAVAHIWGGNPPPSQ